MREIEFNLDENPFINMLSSRYTMSARVNVEKLWNWCHENDKSFFVMSLGCMMNAVNSVPHFKRRIIDGKVIEFDYLEGTTPIMDEGNEAYKEMRLKHRKTLTIFANGMITLKIFQKAYWMGMLKDLN